MAALSEQRPMIADWTVDVGPETPQIELPWAGWVDLQHRDGDSARLPARIEQLQEVAAYPELLALLALANTAELASAKCDVFPIDREEADPELSDAGPEATACGLGSYIDVVALGAGGFAGFSAFEQAARSTAIALQSERLPGASIEIVVRPARLYDRQTFGWTLYAIGFGSDLPGARTTWARCAAVLLTAFTATVAGMARNQAETVGE